jgi:PAS domain S-box-containing protein
MWISFPKFYKIVFAGFFPVLVAIGIGSYFMSNRFADDEELVIHTYKVISMLETVSSELGEAESARHGYVVLGDQAQLREYQAAVQDVPQVLQQLQLLTADNPRQQQHLAQLSPLVRTRLELSRQAMAPQSHDLSPAGPQADLSPQGAVLDAQIRAQLNAMEDEENQLLRERARLSARNQRRSTAFLLLAFLIASIMLVFLFMVMSWEVKRRTEAEVLAKENEERFRLLVSGVQDFAILRLDLDGRISTWNLGAERLFGYQASEILGQPLSHLFRTCDKATPEAHLRTALTVGYVQDECQQLRKDNTVFWSTAHLTLLRNEAGQPHGYALITRDITERREHQQQITQREAQLNAFFSNASVGLAIIDRDLRFQRINGPFSVLNGLQPGENTGLYVRDVVQNLAAEIEPLIRRVLDTGTPVLNHEITGHAPTTPGVTGWWLKSFFPIAREGETVTQIGAVVQDITALKRAESTVRWLSGRLLQMRDDERRRLARDLHDSLGQTLTAVKMNLAYLSRDTSGLDERGRNAMTESKELVDGALREVRTLSHLLHPPMLDEVGLLPAIRWFTSGFSDRSGIEVKLELPSTLRRLPVELETTIFRVVQESLTNVHRHAHSPVALVRLEERENRVDLQVIDHGRGIPPEKLSSRAEGPAIGVGILGMRERLRQLGGQLEIISNQVGTTVRVIIPLTEADP